MATKTRTEERSTVEGGDARIEDYLDSKGVQWRFHPKLKTDEFDAERSLRNQVRFEAVDPGVVDTYAEAMKRGDIFPPVVTHQVGGKHVNADGNHRMQAAIKARKPLAAYEMVDADAAIITLVAFELNTRHGKPTSEAERIHHALYLLENGATIKTAAEAVNLPERVVNKASVRQNTLARFAEQGIAPLVIEKLSETAKWRLAGISTDEGFKAAVDLAIAANLSADQIFDLVTRVNSIRSSNGQENMIKDMRADLLGSIQASGGGVMISQNGKRVMGPRARIGLAVSNILALPDDIPGMAKQWVGADREETAKKAEETAKRLTALAKELRK